MCEGSGRLRSVSDYSVLCRTATCPKCNRRVGITIPDPEMHENVARFVNHSEDFNSSVKESQDE